MPLGRAAVVRPGRDVTIVSAMMGVHHALAAADLLAGHGVDAEVIDLRTIRPLDHETVAASVRRTNRLCIVEEGPLTGGFSAELLALVTELCLGDLDDAWRITHANTPIPYSPPLEDDFLPSADRIAAEVLARP